MMQWLSRIGGALGCLVVATAAHGQGNDRIPEPTHPDVTPGVDHGSSEDQLDYNYRKQAVFYRTDQPAGTIVVHTADRFMFLVLGDGRAERG